MTRQNDLLMDSSILYRSTQKYYDKMLQKLHLSYAQLPILIQIYEHEGISMQQIAKDGGYDKGTVTKNIQKLDNLGYIRIVSSTKDKRSKELYTTAFAKSHMSEIYGIRRDWWHHITQDLNADEIALFSKMYETLSYHARSYADLEQTDLQFYRFDPLNVSVFDGHLACCLYTGGCNLMCPYCNVADLVFLKENVYPISSDVLKAYFKSHQNIIDGIYISGGEPLMHEGIINFLRQFHAYDIKLHTNGMYFDRLKLVVEEQLVDSIALDIKNGPSYYPLTCGMNEMDLSSIEASLQYLKRSKIDFEVCVTIVDGLHTEESILELAKWIEGVPRVILQNFVSSEHMICSKYKCVDVSTIYRYRDIFCEFVDCVKIRGEME